MTTNSKRARLYAQLAFVAHFDAEALAHACDYPMVTPTDEELVEAKRLDAVADLLFDEAEALGFSGGTDAAFGSTDGS